MIGRAVNLELSSWYLLSYKKYFRRLSNSSSIQNAKNSKLGNVTNGHRTQVKVSWQLHFFETEQVWSWFLEQTSQFRLGPVSYHSRRFHSCSAVLPCNFFRLFQIKVKLRFDPSLRAYFFKCKPMLGDDKKQQLNFNSERSNLTFRMERPFSQTASAWQPRRNRRVSNFRARFPCLKNMAQKITRTAKQLVVKQNLINNFRNDVSGNCKWPAKEIVADPALCTFHCTLVEV